MIAQEILTHEAIFKISKLLDQFYEGLKKLRILQLIRAFPDLFAPLFTFTGDISSEMVSEALFIKDESDLHPGDRKILGFLQTFIHACDQTGEVHRTCWCVFMIYVNAQRNVLYRFRL